MTDLCTYVVRARLKTQDLNIQLVASSPELAIKRTRGTLMHRDRDVAWMNKGTFDVLATVPGVLKDPGAEVLTPEGLAIEAGNPVCELCLHVATAHEWVVVGKDTHVIRCSISEEPDDDYDDEQDEL